MVSNTKLEDFRATWLYLQLEEDSTQVILPQECADLLQVTNGDWVRLARI
jgi:arginine N-succinyltransferase